MSVSKKHIILIGMPASGKSTVGILAAEKLGYRFLDSDDVIVKREGRKLQEIIDSEGNDKFLQIEENANLTLGYEDEPLVIATGGSAIYSEKAMLHFRNVGTIVYLNVPYETIKERLGDFALRGVIVPDGFTLKDLYDQRCKICESYADITITEEYNYEIPDAAEALYEALKNHVNNK